MKGTIDTRQLAPDSILQTHVAIIGGGAAGLTLAKTLANKNYKVSVFEAGGYATNEDTATLHSTINKGRPYPLLQNSRAFGLGGATRLWGGHCLPMNDRCFTKRSWISKSEWPFKAHELNPYYKKSHQLLGLEDFEYNPQTIAQQLNKTLLPFNENLVQTNIARYRAVSYSELFVNSLQSASNINMYMFANATEILLHENGKSVAGIKLKTLETNEIVVKANYYILASGGIENARLLLDSNSIQTSGIGNSKDLVGRYFMEHIWYPKGNIALKDPARLNHFYTMQHRLKAKVYTRAHISLAPEMLQEYHIPEFRSELVAVGMENTTNNTKLSSRDKLELLSLPKDLALQTQHIRQSPGLNNQLQKKSFTGYKLMNYVEQVPDFSSRITLSREKNQLGSHRAEVHWKLSEIDVKGIRVGHQIISNEVKAKNIGHFFYEDEGIPDNLEGADGGGHHMGTTRMARTASNGVVDANCKVFDVDNLFIAGSSVFPSAGYANPTLTLTALAIRLATHLDELLQNNSPIELQKSLEKS